MFRKLRTTARLVHTTAHPDDEDGGMLALEARGRGTSVLLMTLNRGEGGQNKTGPELFDALGVLRTLELLASGSYYGVDQRFSRVADFGFSKNAEETITKWKGRDASLADMVRVIRTFRPDVVVSRFAGIQRDGHGNHQAAGALTPEAFRAAGDPRRFPEQIKEGLHPWQPKKLYANNVRQNEQYTLRLDTGAYDPVLGASYTQIALEGLSHQLSQGAGGARAAPGHRFSHYRLVESAVPTRGKNGEKEESFFEGIDVSLTGLAARAGDEAARAPFLKPALERLERTINEAASAFAPENPSRSARSLISSLALAGDLIEQIEKSSLSPPTRVDLLTHLETKRGQLETAVNLSLGVALDVMVDAATREPGEPMSTPSTQQTFLMAVPGQTFTLTAKLFNRSAEPLTPADVVLETPRGWKVSAVKRDFKELGKDDGAEAQFRVTVPGDSPYTRPYWRRDDAQKESIVTIDSPEYLTLALPPPPVRAVATYQAAGGVGRIESAAKVKYVDPLYGQKYRDLVVGPPLSVELQPATGVVAAGKASASNLTVAVRSNVTGPARGILRLELPHGWKAQPSSQPLSFSRDGELSNHSFQITPGALDEGGYEIKAVAEYEGKLYSEGYSVVTRNDLDTFYHYRPARRRISAVAVRVPPRLKVGYVMGAGDEIASVIGQLGINVEQISAGELATGNLNRFDTIVIGIRAYDVRSDVRDNNKRLLEFVERGGTLIVQYNQSTGTFNAGAYTPYPATASNERVTVEEAAVEILDHRDSIFRFPNRITARDFDGWIQERGVYFMNKWDVRFKPLLASHDPGEKPLRGGMLRASYGKGVYIYTGYAFFRQIPAGVPGAVRLFVNLLYAGREAKARNQ
jgi:LmbE family N-acetylglucosaminyl deacetylase